MFFKVPVQSNSFLSRRFRAWLVIAATVGLPFCALARGGDIVEPAPDPEAITTEELSKLIGGPTLVNYVGTDVPAKEAVQVLTSKTKVKPSTFSRNPQIGGLKNISVNWKDMPFWEAASQLEQLADGSWHANSGGLPSFWPNDLGQGENQEIESGLDGLLGAETPVVRVVASSLNRASNIKFLLGGREGHGTVTLDQIRLLMNAYLDPKLDVRAVQARQLKFQSKPNAPVVDGSKIYEVVTFGRDINAISQHNIHFPQGMAIAPKSRFYRVSGILHTVIATASETWKIPDLVAAGKVEHTIGGTQYSLENVEIKNNQLTAKVTVLRPANRKNVEKNADMQLVNVGNTPAQVRDAQGREVQNTGSSINYGDGKMEVNLSFYLKTNTGEDAVGPYSLEWNIPTEQRSYDVPFELRDVPMP